MLGVGFTMIREHGLVSEPVAVAMGIALIVLPLIAAWALWRDGSHGALPGLLQALEIPNPILIGHSDGASIALILAGVVVLRLFSRAAVH